MELQIIFSLISPVARPTLAIQRLDTEEKVFVDVFSKHKKQRKVCLQFFKIDARSRFGGYWVQCAGEKRLNTANCFEASQLLQLSKLTHIHDICPFFSTDTIFGSIFLHTKVRKSHQNRFSDKSA